MKDEIDAWALDAEAKMIQVALSIHQVLLLIQVRGIMSSLFLFLET